MNVPLPIDAAIPDIEAALSRHRAVVVVAEPGAGKTTRIPPALAAHGPLILLQPRRAAARAVAHRIAEERAWTPGVEVGWQVRFEKRFSDRTRVLVATEGILNARLRADPLLSEFRTVVLDEFHERSLHADLAIALAREAWRARDDLYVVVMSATIDTTQLSAYLNGCPVVTVPGRMHPVDIRYCPELTVTNATLRALGEVDGDVLVFQPGAREIGEVVHQLHTRVPAGTEVIPLHGSLPLEEQQRALVPPTAGRRVIVATNVAETSITVPGVRAVVDSGVEKVARYDTARGIDTLTLQRISQAAAEQRAGRAGRTAPGIAYRLWDITDRLLPYRTPDVQRADVSGAVLDVIAWGGDPLRFDWFERPRQDRLDAALALLRRLGAVDGVAITPSGRAISNWPLSPRIGRILLEGRGHPDVARCCAILTDPASNRTTPDASSDLLTALDRWSDVAPTVRQLASELARLVGRTGDRAAGHLAVQRAVLAGYPDRVAQRRVPGRDLFLMASGTGAVLSRGATLDTAAYVVAIELRGSDRPNATDGIISLAVAVERDWLQPNGLSVEHRIGQDGRVRARQLDKYDSLVLGERAVQPEPDEAARLLADAYLNRGVAPQDEQLLRRAAFARIDLDFAALVTQAARVADSLDALTIRSQLPPSLLRDLDRWAPETVQVPSGRRLSLQYGDDGTVSVEVKLQELFGLADTPRIGRNNVPLTLILLAPNGRPVQTTSDLRSFWTRTYADVRKELRGRYPRHPWPEDPWTATPTARAKPRTRA